MKKIMFLTTVVAALLLTSCYATRTQTGNYRELVKEEKTDTYTYAKSKQAYLFWGLIPLGRTQVATPSHGSCQVKTHWGFVDGLVGLLTGGIVTMQTIKIKAPVILKNNDRTEFSQTNAEDGIDLMTELSAAEAAY